MVSCFFCQNLMSDFMEGVLPVSRQAEIQVHIEGCRECSSLHRNLKDTVGFLKKLPSVGAGPELKELAKVASIASLHPWSSQIRASRWVLASLVPLVAVVGFFMVFPQHFPFSDLLSRSDDETQFVRFFPLMQGASEIVDEQTSWLHGRDLDGGSLWDEGGISPDEFEKSFGSPAREVPP